MASASPFVSVLVFCCIWTSSVGAAGFPERPIRMIALNPPGGVSDTCARVVGDKLTERWAQQVVVDNRVGAGGIIGSEIVAKAPPDGHTLLLGFVGNLAINPGLYAKLPYDPQKDFAPISLVARSPIVVAISPALPAKSIQEFIALAKARPKKIAYSSSGNGNGNHLATELFASMTGIELLHVPFKGGPPALTAVMRGDTQLMFGNAVFTVPQVKAGRVRAIAVTTERRISLLPDVPTISESGYKNYVVTTWFGVLAPAGTPSTIVNKLNAEIVSILSEEDVKQKFDNAALIVTASTSSEFANLIQTETRRWTEVIRKTGTKAD